MSAYECFVIGALLNIAGPLYYLAFEVHKHPTTRGLAGFGSFLTGCFFWACGIAALVHQ